MQIGGEPKRVRLLQDLTRYHPNAKAGAMGWTIPDAQISSWGTFDRFVAVRFDEGGRLGVLWQSLEVVEEKKP